MKNDKPIPAAPLSSASAAAMALLSEPSTLGGKTLRSIILLVGSCVLFVGALSTAAVVITSKAMGPSAASAPQTSDARDTNTPKKPLSI